MKSVIRRTDSATFRNIVASCTSYKQILSFFGLKNHGNNFRTVKKRITEEMIDDSHIHCGSSGGVRKKIPLEEILVEKSTYTNRDNLKKNLINKGLLKNQCYMCGLSPLWNGKRLVLVLDHINGKNSDNRIENLRLLCPNCNSQTDTFCGRSKRRTYNCVCGKELKGHGKTGLCHSCLIRKQNLSPQKRKFEISKENLERLVWEKPASRIAEEFHVSGAAIKKRCKLLKIVPPGRGYWAKKLHGTIESV